MTTGSRFQTTGIGVSVWRPTIDVTTPLYTPRGVLLYSNLERDIDSYGHEILTDGGWWSASIEMRASYAEAENWLEEGLNRHVEVNNPAGILVWEGFVNEVTIAAGTLSAVRGPLMDISNRASVVYTPILDPTTTPPTEGSETTTTIADDAASRASYGVFESVVSGGKLLDDGVTDDAAQLRDTYLAENAQPQTGESLSLSAGEEAHVSLSLLGYVHRFQRWVYQDATAATVQIDAKIPLVIAADPNGMFSTDYGRIAANAVLTSRYTDDNRMAWDVLRDDVALGGAAYNRYTLGVYADRQVVFQPIPTAAEYQHAITSNELHIKQFARDVTVDPWDVLPARWVFLFDFLVGRGLPGTLRDDPRYMFIEGVRYTAPNTLELDGQKVARLPQLIARTGG